MSPVDLVKTKSRVLGDIIDLSIIAFKRGADKATSLAQFKGVSFYSLSEFL